MRYCLVNCLYITVVCQFVFAFLVSSKESGNPKESDLDDSEKLLYNTLDKSDWVDYGDMFTYDLATKTNREPKLKTAVEMVIKRRKEAQQNADQFESLPSNCDAVEQKLRECEAKKRLTYDCARNDHCGKLSYLIVRRLIMKLSKLIDNRYYAGSTIGLSVNLDDYFFDLPFDFSNLTDCDYLVQINPLIDRLISSVVISIPKSNNVFYAYLYKYGTTAIGIIAALLWFGLKMSNQERCYALLFSFMSVAYIIEYCSLLETHKAHSQETIDRLKLTCTQLDDQDWSGWLKSMLPVMSFKSSKNECRDYYTALYVSPYLQINPITPFFTIFTEILSHLMKLIADTCGASVASFFSHIPALYFIPILISSVVLFIFAMKYFFKYRNSPRIIFPKQKNIFVEKETKSMPKFKETITDETKPPKLERRRRTKKTLVKCSSLGNIRDLCF